MIDIITPPLCGRVRFVAALVMLAVAFPRLPMVSGFNYGVLGLFDAATYAYALFPLGVLLLITSYRWRLAPFGRAVAVLGFAAWVTLGAATTRLTSLLIDAIMAVIMFTEIVARNDC